jgi:signal peptidase II
MTEKPSTKKRNILFAIAAVLSIGFDQWTKVLAREHLKPLLRLRPPHDSMNVVSGCFKLHYSENTGVAFGIGQDLPGGKYLLTLIALFALLIVGYYLVKSGPRQTRLHLALGLVGGGAVGNLIDRIAFGRVTDFIVWYVGTHEWPAFNIADAALVVGVALMALDMILDRRKPATDEATSEPTGGKAG